jgi:[protein-PII] uridylyltransferase
MGLAPGQVADVEFLVREHLTLAKLAVHRDLNDQRTIDEATARAGDVRRLAMLYLITRADSMATGPEAWSSFRAMLVRELYSKTLAALEGEGGLTPVPASEPSLLSEPLTSGEIRTSVRAVDEAYEFVLVAHDRPGLFATVCGALALRGIDIHDAEIYTRDDGIAVDVLRVIGSHGAVPEERWGRIEADIRAALSAELDLDEALGRKAAQARRRRLPRGRGRPANIVIDNNASETHTVIEVHAEDHLGLLREITKALYDAGCDLSLAKVATYGTDVVDAFYVCDLNGSKIAEAAHLARVEQRLRMVLGSPRAATG